MIRKTIPKEKKRKPLAPFSRKLHIDGGEWSFRITSHVVMVRDPDGKQTWRIQLPDIMGATWEEIERAHDNCEPLGICPSMIKDWINNNIVPDLAQA